MTHHFHLLNTCGNSQMRRMKTEFSTAAARRLWSPSATLGRCRNARSKAHPILYLVNRVRKCQKKLLIILHGGSSMACCPKPYLMEDKESCGCTIEACFSCNSIRPLGRCAVHEVGEEE